MTTAVFRFKLAETTCHSKGALKMSSTLQLPDLLTPELSIITAQDREALAELRALCSDALRDLAIRAGGFVFHRFFDASEERLSAHTPGKLDEFGGFAQRTAAELGEIGLEAKTLLAYARVFAVYRQMPPPVQQALNPSHYVELQRLSAPVDRTELALRAGREGWSVRQLRGEVDAWRASNLAPSHAGGRPPLPAAVKAWGAAARSVARLGADAGELASLTGPQRAAVLGHLQALEREIAAVRAQLELGDSGSGGVD